LGESDEEEKMASLSSQLLEQNRTAFQAGAAIGGAFFEGMEAAPREREQALRLRILERQDKASEFESKTFDQVLTENPLEQLKEVGTMEDSEIPGWLKKHIKWVSVPQLKDLWNKVAEGYSKSMTAMASVEFAKRQAELAIEEGIDINSATPDDWRRARMNRNIRRFRVEARAAYKDPSAIDVSSPDNFDSQGHWLPGREDQLFQAAPRSQLLQSREEMAADKNAALEQQRQIMNDLREKGISLREQKLENDQKFQEKKITLEEHRLNNQNISQQQRGIDLQWKSVEQQRKAAESGFKIENPPVIPGAPGSPRLVPVARPPTLTTVGQAQQRLIANEKTLEEINEFDASVKAGHVGFRGVFGELFLDRLLPQLGFDTADIERIRTRKTLRATIEGSLRQMTEDSRFSNEDRRDIKAIWPDVGIAESLPHTKQVTHLLRRLFSKRALIDAKSINRDAPPFALDNYGQSLRDAMESGLMTYEDAGADMAHSIRNGLLDKPAGQLLFGKFIEPYRK